MSYQAIKKHGGNLDVYSYKSERNLSEKFSKCMIPTIQHSGKG